MLKRIILLLSLTTSLSIGQSVFPPPASGTGTGTGTMTSLATVFPSSLFNASTCDITVTASGTVNCTFATGQTADEILGTYNGTVGFASLVTCSGVTNAVTYNTTTHAWGCNTISSGFSSGSSNLADAASVAISLTQPTTYVAQLTANTTLTIGTPADGQQITIVAQQNGSTAFTITFPVLFHGVSPMWSSSWTLSKFNSQTWKYFVSCSCALAENVVNQ